MRALAVALLPLLAGCSSDGEVEALHNVDVRVRNATDASVVVRYRHELIAGWNDTNDDGTGDEAVRFVTDRAESIPVGALRTLAVYAGDDPIEVHATYRDHLRRFLVDGYRSGGHDLQIGIIDFAPSAALPIGTG